MLDKDSIQISGKFTIGDWKELRLKLIKERNKNAWKKAIMVFHKRISTRYLRPIKKILSIKKDSGEGFSAVALMCLLIEYIESFYQGKIYFYKDSKRNDLEYDHPFQYSKSFGLFVNFFTVHEPFKTYFIRNSPVTFYYDIRCGLLHEAATKKYSLIRNKGDSIIDIDSENKGIIVNRNKFFNALIDFIKEYESRLYKDPDLQKRFFRKMDSLALIEKITVFAYGSLLLDTEIRKIVNIYSDVCVGYLMDYELIFNKISIDGSAKANIIKSEGSRVWGFCYEIEKVDISKLSKREKGYSDRKVKVFTSDTNYFDAKVFISRKVSDSDISPTYDYLKKIIKGAENRNLPVEYVNTYIKKYLK